jgi:malonyl-CoA/methylmalonyl-CoA synthetase
MNMTRPFDHFDLDRWRVNPPPIPGGIYSLFREVFHRFASKPALEMPNGPVYTFAELDDAVEQCRQRLAWCGVERGDRVLAYIAKSPANVLLYLACLRHGAVYVPINPAYTPAELAALVADCAPRLVVCDPDQRPALARSLGEPATRPRLVSLPPDGMIMPAVDTVRASELPEVTGGDPAVILYTSGTTGKPRGAVLTHRAVAANGLALCRTWDLRTEDVLIHSLPLFHTHGLLVALNCALLSGASTILMPAFDPVEAIRHFVRATVFMGVPTYYTRLLEQTGLSEWSSLKMRLFTCGSAPLLPKVWEQFRRRCGHRIVERYGMTEVGILTSNPFFGERIPGSVGFPLEGVDIKVVDRSGVEVGPGVTGELWAKTAGAFDGYLNNPEETERTVDPQGWVATGDLAIVSEKGRITLKGRAKDLIITGGLNVHPTEVEVILNSVEGVAESAVFGTPHPDFGEAVVASVVWGPGHPPSPARIRQVLASRLAGYKHPKRILSTDALPRNAMGKVQKAVLRSRHAALFD